ncbi:MAG: tyrosine--tRNA ligase, partial [Parcubacteria group bacterium]|nr:tyrosine--tRNA ligase [Parcubacteria group bacterium]
RLASEFTVQQMVERDMFEKRLKDGKPIGLHEFLYPLMQGYDSVQMEVDVEIGGNDQLFNMLAGRTLLRTLKGKEKHVVTTPLLEGLDGRKMSKSYGNTVNITDDPADMYGKIMSIADELIITYFELCTDVPSSEIHDIAAVLKQGAKARDAKARLAFEIVKLYHGQRAAEEAEEEFEKVFRKGERPEEITVVKVRGAKHQARDLLVHLGMASSKSEAGRLIQQGGVKIDDKVVRDWKWSVSPKSGMVVQVGKRKFVKIETT